MPVFTTYHSLADTTNFQISLPLREHHQLTSSSSLEKGCYCNCVIVFCRYHCTTHTVCRFSKHKSNNGSKYQMIGSHGHYYDSNQQKMKAQTQMMKPMMKTMMIALAMVHYESSQIPHTCKSINGINRHWRPVTTNSRNPSSSSYSTPSTELILKFHIIESHGRCYEQ